MKKDTVKLAGRRDEEMEARLRRHLDWQPTVTRCARCPWWKWTGPAWKGRLKFAEHAEKRHR